MTGLLPADLGIAIDDIDLNQRVDLGVDSAFTIASFGSLQPRRFRLIVGRRTFVETHASTSEVVPSPTVLHPGYPNPMAYVSTIRFETAETEHVSLRVIDVLGRTVATLRDQTVAAGRHTLIWNETTDTGGMLSNGLYFLKMQTPGTVGIERLIIAR